MKIFQNKITGTQSSFFTNFSDKRSFSLSYLFRERLHCCSIYFHCPSCTITIIRLEPCALNAQFQHFILRFDRNFLTLWIPLKEGIGWRQGDILRITLICHEVPQERISLLVHTSNLVNLVEHSSECGTNWKLHLLLCSLSPQQLEAEQMKEATEMYTGTASMMP